MKNKNKYIAATLATAALFVPLFALAQFDLNAGGGGNVPTASITVIIKNVMNWLLMIVSMLAVIAFLIAGILYLTAAGDQTRIDSAKKAMIASITGVVVALLGLLVVQVVSRILGGQAQF